ncbi:Uncharacterized protein Fot_04060 [Forsythia ovata]|uniref:Uncharacterized protein n=1 Tax=Forsythia ovata TaxID=205694 RepID=A0ABD1XBH6_9LAMI
MFSCLISSLCLAEGVPLLPHEEIEIPEPPINKWTLGNPMARQGADNPAPIPVAKTGRLLHQIFTQLSEQEGPCYCARESTCVIISLAVQRRDHHGRYRLTLYRLESTQKHFHADSKPISKYQTIEQLLMFNAP